MDAIAEFFRNNDMQQLAVQWGFNIVIALAIFIIGKWVAKSITKAFRKVLVLREMDDTLVGFLGNLVYAVLLTAVVIAALDYLGLPITSLVVRDDDRQHRSDHSPRVTS